ESVHAGLSTIRLVSILAAVAAIYYAYQIGRRLSFPWPAQVLILGYLAADHLQIFFGMAGMETQVATALVLANAHFYLSGQWRLLGFATGFAVICRPEFGLWAVIMGGVLLIWHRKAVLGFAIPAATVALPWFIFATLYYGSPVPHPVVVKSYDSPLGSMDWSQILDWPQILAYLKLWWKEVAPFRQYFAWNHSPPVSDIWLQVIVGVAAACAAIGAKWAARIEPRILTVFAFLVGFIIYRTAARVNPYFMWYLPPFTALFFLFAAAGVAWLYWLQRAASAVVGCWLFASYAMHLPFTMQLDKRVQDIE